MNDDNYRWGDNQRDLADLDAWITREPDADDCIEGAEEPVAVEGGAALRLYGLALPDDAHTGATHDVVDGFVVVSASPEAARALVTGQCSDECGCRAGERTGCAWGMGAEVELLGVAVPGAVERVVARSFRAG